MSESSSAISDVVGALMQERDELRYIGDGMQSAASRMAEWIASLPPSDKPYEVSMAAFEAQDYVAQWTDARIGYALERPADLPSDAPGTRTSTPADRTSSGALAVTRQQTNLMRNLRRPTPVRGMELVIHRGPECRWFTINGKRYNLLQNGPGYGWSIHDPESGRTVADNYFTLTEVRIDAARAVQAWLEGGEDD